MRRLIVLNFCLLILASQGWCDNLATAVEHYNTDLNAELQKLGPNDDPAIAAYLRKCLANAELLQGLPVGSTRAQDALSVIGPARKAEIDAFPAGVSSSSSIRAEYEAYRATILPFALERYLSWLPLQNELLERKYFKSNTAKTSNFIEGYINGNWKLTHADPDASDDVSRKRPLGVSPWEAILRFEPALAIQGGAQPLIIGAGGLSYTFFPRVEKEPHPHLVERFSSHWVKKSGVRLGIGAGQFDGKTRLVVGPGTQINAVAIWGLYEPKDKKWMLAVGISNMAKLKKVVGWFD